MAMAMAQAAAHSAPPFPLPALPRIRPPPIPKGTPGPNTIPQPPRDGAGSGRVWADGRWRDPNSSSAKHLRDVRSRQVEKALRHETLGMNIYAYRHHKSNQVVYSLTKVMDNTKMMKQLLFHGKKTVPSALRRDKWRPHFAVHFPQTPAGAAKGLKVFRDLRELSMQRQLAPPKELVVATHADRMSFMQKTGDFLLESRLRRDRDPLKHPRAKNFAPVAGKRLSPIMVAKRLMNQKLSSVADIAAVLTRYQKLDTKAGRVLTPKETLEAEERAREVRDADRSDRYQKRLEKIRTEEKETADRVKSRERMLEAPGDTPLSPHARQRIYAEHGGPELRNIVQSDLATARESGGIMSKEERLDYLAAEEELAVSQAVEKLVAEIDQQHADSRKDLELVYEAELSSKIAQLNASHSDRAPTKVVLESGREVHFVAQYADLASSVQKARHDIHSQYGQKRKALLEAYRNGTLEPLPQEVLRSRDLEPSTHAVTISWASPADKFFAPFWPDLVTHSSLDPAAITQSTNGRWSANPHILGADKLSTPEDFDHLVNYAYPKSIEEREQTRGRVLEKAHLETELAAYQDVLNLRQQLVRRRAEILEPRNPAVDKKVKAHKKIAIVQSGTTDEAAFTLLDQEMLQFLRGDLSKAQYPFTNTILDELENACSNLQAARLGYGPEDSVLDPETSTQARAHAEYIRKNLHYAEPELAATPELLKRLAYVRDATDLIITELERPRARHLADLKTTFDSIVATRMAIVSQLQNMPSEEELLIKKAAAEAVAAADLGSDEIDALNQQISSRRRLEEAVSDIDEQYAFAAELVRRQDQRREDIVNLQNEINELTETIEAHHAERDQLEAQFIAEHKELAETPSTATKEKTQIEDDATTPSTSTESASSSSPATATASLAAKTIETKIEITSLRFDKIEQTIKDEKSRLTDLQRQQKRMATVSAREEYWRELVKQNSLGSRTFIDRAVEAALQKRRRAGSGSEEAMMDDEEVVVPERRGLIARIPLLGRLVSR